MTSVQNNFNGLRFLKFGRHTVKTRQRLHKKRIKNKSKGYSRNKNKIKLIITNKNFSKEFQA